MTSLTDRYVHAVTTQLPDSQRADIARELRATIEDTVAGAAEGTDPAEAERRAVRELGHPTALADCYRGEGRALIGPRLYPAWLRTLKALLSWVPALVGLLLLIVGVFDEDPAINIIGSVLSGLFWSALQVAFWVTLGFAIAERTGTGTETLGAVDAVGAVDGDDWDPAELPEPPTRQVSWGDAMASVVLDAFLLALLVLPFRFGGRIEDVEWGPIFTDTAYSLRWVLALGVAMSLLANIYVLARRRWTWPTAIINFLGSLLFVAPMVWLASRNDLFSWDSLPLQWIRGETLQINETATLVTTVVVLLGIFLWETVDSFRKAARSD